MCDTLRHRGPDDEGFFVDGTVALGMRRLSIIDLASGHQPIFNEDRNLVIVFNGEIYNYQELRLQLTARGHVFATRSDTETILHAYEEHGPESLLQLNGMFAFAIFDRASRGLFLARDHLGIKPLYYHVNDERLVFASEVKSLLSMVDPEVDREALAEYMATGYVSGDRTLFKGIRKLPAGHYMIVTGRAMVIRKYWQLPKMTDDRDLGASYYATRLHETVVRAIKRQMVSDVPLGAFLSGGMDSSSIVQSMSQVSNGPINTYTIGFGSKHALHDELESARYTARSLGTNHHEITVEPRIVDLLPRLVWHLDEPVGDSSYIVTYLVSQLAAQTVKVILSGVGGDELFGGYRRYLGFTLNKYLGFLPRNLRESMQQLLMYLPARRETTIGNFARMARSYLHSLDQPGLAQYRSLLSTFSEPVLSGHNGSNGHRLDETFAMAIFSSDLNSGDLLQQMQNYDLRHSLVDDLLLLTDKMSMACSLETRVPLLDLEVVEFAASIPSKYKVNGFQLRNVQRLAMKHDLPSVVLRKPKKGFGCPIGAWVKTELRDYIRDCLSPQRLARHGLFDSSAVSKMLDDHYAARADYTDLLMVLLTFEIWFDTFISPGRLRPAATLQPPTSK
jgi:asparagine synthase (glutamine-hydrolysing)